MLRIIRKLFVDIDTIDRLFNKLGLSAAALTVTTTTVRASEVAVVNDALVYSLSSTDIALVISSIGGVLFCVEKILMIYIRYKEAARTHAEDDDEQ